MYPVIYVQKKCVNILNDLDLSINVCCSRRTIVVVRALPSFSCIRQVPSTDWWHLDPISLTADGWFSAPESNERTERNSVLWLDCTLNEHCPMNVQIKSNIYSPARTFLSVSKPIWNNPWSNQISTKRMFATTFKATDRLWIYSHWKRIVLSLNSMIMVSSHVFRTRIVRNSSSSILFVADLIRSTSLLTSCLDFVVHV